MYSKIFPFLLFIFLFKQEFSINANSINENLAGIVTNLKNRQNFVHEGEKLLTGARVKRDKLENEDNAKLQASYLEDLAASFPKSEHELEDGTALITSENIEDDKVFKRSSTSNNGKRFAQYCHMKVNRHLENPRFKESSHMYEVNSNLNDNQPQIFSTEDYSDSANDNDEKYLQNSDRHNFGNSNYEFATNFAARRQKESKLSQSEQKREVKLKNETNSSEKNYIKNETTEKTSSSPNKTVQRRALLRGKRRMKKSKKHIKKNKKHAKKHKNHKKDKRNKNKVKHSRKFKESS